jgi:biopolymer transport protein ExbD
MAGGAGGYSDEGDEGLISDINVTPLVDIVLVLLIVFMVTVPSIVVQDVIRERELAVVLPQASEAMPLTAKPKEVFVTVDVNGQYSVRGLVQTEAELYQVLQQAWADNPGRATVIIRADKRCHWQAVVTVMNLCNRANIHDYRVMAE